MAKRQKNQARQGLKASRHSQRHPQRGATGMAGDRTAVIVANPPAKNFSLLAASITLFAIWFVFLLVTALLS